MPMSENRAVWPSLGTDRKEKLNPSKLREDSAVEYYDLARSCARGPEAERDTKFLFCLLII